MDRADFINAAPWDRALRVLVGVSMLLAGWSGLASGVWGVALLVFAWPPLLTGLFGWDPVYALLGGGTQRRRSRPRRHGAPRGGGP